jgi:hypothetical protein
VNNGLVVRQAVADQTTLRVILMLRLEEGEVLVLPDAVTVVLQLEADDVAALTGNLGLEEVGTDGDRVGFFRYSGQLPPQAPPAAARAGCCSVSGRVLLPFPQQRPAGAFGWLYFCQASHSMTSENENMSSSRRRRLSMKT